MLYLRVCTLKIKLCLSRNVYNKIIKQSKCGIIIYVYTVKRIKLVDFYVSKTVCQ